MGTIKQIFNVIDNFYEENDFMTLITAANLNSYIATYQPYNNINFINRLQAYACYETKEMVNEDNLLKIFISTFEKKTNLKIKRIQTFIRKIINSELKHVFEYGLPKHKDSTENFQIAGVIYINTFNLKDGTRLFSFEQQIEPDILIGSKPNRCVYYDTNIWHSPGHNENTEVRFVQPFFIALEK